MRFKDCDTCLVYGSDRKPLSRARVEEINDKQIRLYFTSSKLRNARLKTLVDFYDGQQGLMRCLCEVVLRQNTQVNRFTEPWMADCVIVKVYEIFQRQKDLRVKVHISTDFRLDSGIIFPGTIQNISAGGLYFATGQRLMLKQEFLFKHSFRTEVSTVRARVLRIHNLSQNGFGYGCQFINLTLGLESDIRNFVYNRQIEMQLEKQPSQEEDL